MIANNKPIPDITVFDDDFDDISDLLGIEDHYSVDERALLEAYRKHPEMQKAVKTLLEIE